MKRFNWDDFKGDGKSDPGKSSTGSPIFDGLLYLVGIFLVIVAIVVLTDIFH